ncbi:hypothetical protein Mapa_004989 [Marchantia paleacea]|nr:hypothetical protein Mapa_004989 [Marchantia paleacea]
MERRKQSLHDRDESTGTGIRSDSSTGEAGDEAKFALAFTAWNDPVLSLASQSRQPYAL